MTESSTKTVSRLWNKHLKPAPESPARASVDDLGSRDGYSNQSVGHVKTSKQSKKRTLPSIG
ncbi:hypothetical protein N7490_007611 [Penicillium lividum]|nr:hypothetical protein N7490_007611 [Penicillium lividum]